MLFLASEVNGIGRMRSGLPGHMMVRLTIFTSGSLFSELHHKDLCLLDFSWLKDNDLKCNLMVHILLKQNPRLLSTLFTKICQKTR